MTRFEFGDIVQIADEEWDVLAVEDSFLDGDRQTLWLMERGGRKTMTLLGETAKNLGAKAVGHFMDVHAMENEAMDD